MIKKESRNSMRIVRHSRIRSKISGTSEIPRLCVFRSNTGIYAQIIDDEKQTTIVAASSMDKDLKIKNGSNIEAAKLVGAEIAKRAAEKNITTVVFDRGGYIYHGRVQALADAAREAGLKF